MNRDDVLNKLSQKNVDIEIVKNIYSDHIGDMEIESMVAMNLSQRTSVYEREKEKSGTMSFLLEQLAESESMEARWAVAKNPHTAEGILKKLSNDKINLVRALVATNINTPASVLTKFFSDEKIVRDGLSGNPNTPLKILKIIADDSDKMVRLRVAENLSATKEILDKLSNDSDKDVSTAAKLKLEI